MSDKYLSCDEMHLIHDRKCSESSGLLSRRSARCLKPGPSPPRARALGPLLSRQTQVSGWLFGVLSRFRGVPRTSTVGRKIFPLHVARNLRACCCKCASDASRRRNTVLYRSRFTVQGITEPCRLQRGQMTLIMSPMFVTLLQIPPAARPAS